MSIMAFLAGVVTVLVVEIVLVVALYVRAVRRIPGRAPIMN